jgi:hypothetical protein
MVILGPIGPRLTEMQDRLVEGGRPPLFFRYRQGAPRPSAGGSKPGFAAFAT